MYKLWGLRWFLRQLSPLKVNTWLKKWKRHDNYEPSPKKDTATILRITAWNWISVETTMLMWHWFNFRAQNSKLWPSLFLVTVCLLRIFLFNFHPTLTANKFGLKLSKLKSYNIFGILRTSAFSWYTPFRSYWWKTLRKMRFRFSSFHQK